MRVSSVLRLTLALLFGILMSPDAIPLHRAVNGKIGDVQLVVQPTAPMSADIVRIQIERGASESGPMQQALRVRGTHTFYAEAGDGPSVGTYRLGALEPGEYTFLLLQKTQTTDGCQHERLGEVHFAVESPTPSGSGRIALLTQRTNAEAVRRLIQTESPEVNWLFGQTAILRMISGLELSYRRSLRDVDEVRSVEFDSIGFVPECPPPLGSAYVPGSLLVSFESNVRRSEASVMLRALPPSLEVFWPLSLLGEPSVALTIVQVPHGWEELLLRRYRRAPGILSGWVVPVPARSGNPSNSRPMK